MIHASNVDALLQSLQTFVQFVSFLFLIILTYQCSKNMYAIGYKVWKSLLKREKSRFHPHTKAALLLFWFLSRCVCGCMALGPQTTVISSCAFRQKLRCWGGGKFDILPPPRQLFQAVWATWSKFRICCAVVRFVSNLWCFTFTSGHDQRVKRRRTRRRGHHLLVHSDHVSLLQQFLDQFPVVLEDRRRLAGLSSHERLVIQNSQVWYDALHCLPVVVVRLKWVHFRCEKKNHLFGVVMCVESCFSPIAEESNFEVFGKYTSEVESELEILNYFVDPTVSWTALQHNFSEGNKQTSRINGRNLRTPLSWNDWHRHLSPSAPWRKKNEMSRKTIGITGFPCIHSWFLGGFLVLLLLLFILFFWLWVNYWKQKTFQELFSECVLASGKFRKSLQSYISWKRKICKLFHWRS